MQPTRELSQLRHRWGLVTAVYGATIFVFYLIFRQMWPEGAGLWLAVTAVVAVYVLGTVYRYLPENHRQGETTLLPRFGWGNGLTLLRGLTISLMAGFLFSPWPGGWVGWLPAIFFTITDIADFLDGYAARKTNHATKLGERLDVTFDGFGTLLVTLLAVWFGQLPWWYLLIGLARYLFLFGLWLRTKRHRPLYEMHFSWHRRIFAGFQMGFMSVVLWPIVPAGGAAIAGTMFALATAASFLRDWLLVSGRLQPDTVRYRQWRHRLYRFTAVSLPPFFRLGLLVCLLVYTQNLLSDSQPLPWTALFAGWGLPAPPALVIFWAVSGVVATGFVVVGVAGRLGAFCLLFPYGFDIAAQGLTPLNAWGLVSTLYILMLGSGALSLWQPEEKYMVRHAGSR